MYEIKYLPIAKRDITDIINYISNDLKAPRAAINLLDSLDKSISRLEQFPYSCKVYQPINELENEYRILPVNNYLVFYVVKENAVEIHRIIYAKMNITNFIR